MWQKRPSRERALIFELSKISPQVGLAVQPIPLAVTFSKPQSSKLERLFWHVSVKRDVRALSFELWNIIRKCHPKFESGIGCTLTSTKDLNVCKLVRWTKFVLFSYFSACECPVPSLQGRAIFGLTRIRDSARLLGESCEKKLRGHSGQKFARKSRNSCQLNGGGVGA